MRSNDTLRAGPDSAMDPFPASPDALVDLLSTPDWRIRRRARAALVEQRAAAIPALLRALTDRRDDVRWEAAKALCEYRSAACAPALVDALDDPDGGVRWLAAEALVTIGPPSLAPLLRRLEAHSESVWLQEGAHHVLHAFERGDFGEIVAPVLRALERPWAQIGVLPAVEEALHKLEMRAS